MQSGAKLLRFSPHEEASHSGHPSNSFPALREVGTDFTQRSVRKKGCPGSDGSMSGQ